MRLELDAGFNPWDCVADLFNSESFQPARHRIAGENPDLRNANPSIVDSKSWSAGDLKSKWTSFKSTLTLWKRNYDKSGQYNSDKANFAIIGNCKCPNKCMSSSACFVATTVSLILFLLDVAGQRRKDHGGLYVWIYLDSENLTNLACKELPAEIASEEGLGDKDIPTCDYDLEDDFTEASRVKKRVKSRGQATNSADGNEEYPTTLQQITSVVTNMIMAKDDSGTVSDDAVKSAQARECNALADESKLRALHALLTHADQEIALKAKTLVFSQLDKWGHN